MFVSAFVLIGGCIVKQVRKCVAVTRARKGGFRLEDVLFVIRNDRKKYARAKVHNAL